jgi:hypothetical protein
MLITTKDGFSYSIDSWDVGDYLAIQPEFNPPPWQTKKYWAISHKPSGKIVLQCFRTPTAALVVAKQLILLDWSPINSGEKPSDEFREELEQILIKNRRLLFSAVPSPSEGNGLLNRLVRSQPRVPAALSLRYPRRSSPIAIAYQNFVLTD